jgi:hypothetical protein
VGYERASGGAAGQRLQYWRLDFEKAPALECGAHRAHHRHPLAGNGACLGTDDQIDIALPHPGLFAHLFMGDGKGAQRL